MKQPVTFQRLEAAILFIVTIWGYHHIHGPWWLFIILFFAIDLSAIGYLVNSRLGALTYNIGHAAIIPIIVLGFVFITQIHDSYIDYLYYLVIIWLSHIGADRMFGFGLKYSSGFQDTHLGRIGHR